MAAEKQWKRIEGFEDYEVSDSGTIKHSAFTTTDGRNKPECILKGIPDKDGYTQVRLWKNGKGHTKKIHRLVAEAFIPNPNRLPCVNHKDGCKHNNSLENLEWCDHSQNMVHAYAYGLRKAHKGESNSQHKLTNEDVEYIRTNCILNDLNYGIRAMARKFHVQNSTVRNIYYCLKWRTENERK